MHGRSSPLQSINADAVHSARWRNLVQLSPMSSVRWPRAQPGLPRGVLLAGRSYRGYVRRILSSISLLSIGYHVSRNPLFCRGIEKCEGVLEKINHSQRLAAIKSQWWASLEPRRSAGIGYIDGSDSNRWWKCLEWANRALDDVGPKK